MTARSRRWVIRILTGIGILAAGAAYLFFSGSDYVPIPVRSENTSAEEADLPEEVSRDESFAEWIYVHVTGAVAKPDQVVRLESGVRVIDAIEAAGGSLDEADLGRLNLAAKLADGQRLYVPFVGEDSVPAGQVPGLNDSGSAEKSLTNLNTASKMELQALPGIGPALAGRIITYRETKGAFASIEQIMNVSGIGEVLFQQIRDLITV
ncbi:MAG: helix-hairpin-helix domain-containing protein [Firmicutes bacterium]|nr:helix-hairpin-helix domain-containing protein [Bacillota bacterium]